MQSSKEQQKNESHLQKKEQRSKTITLPYQHLSSMHFPPPNQDAATTLSKCPRMRFRRARISRALRSRSSGLSRYLAAPAAHRALSLSIILLRSLRPPPRPPHPSCSNTNRRRTYTHTHRHMCTCVYVERWRPGA